MNFSVNHPWDISQYEAINLQEQLAKQVILIDNLPESPRFIAGVDVAYEKHGGNRVFAGVVIVDVNTMKTVETSSFIGQTSFPYISGLFAFRELPSILEAYQSISIQPDLIICDGQGIAHPRRMGLASHLGLLLDKPTIGCGKTCLIGEYTTLQEVRGSVSPLRIEGEQIGSAVRTQSGIKPVYVSSGHRISLNTSVDWILKTACKFRQPEPIRQVNEFVNKLRSKHS